MDLTDTQISQLASEIQDYQITHGFLIKLVKFEEPTTVPARPVSVSLRPTAFSSRLFQDALALQPSYNELYIRASNDHEWLEGELAPLFKYDEFVHALWQIFRNVHKAGQTQSITCGIFRSDYMIQADSMSLKQVEMNTFSVAGACHAERAIKTHQHVQRILGRSIPTQGDLPESHNTSSIVESLSLAHQHYKPSTLRPACVLMIVQGWNFNICDERPIEYGLVENGIPCYRCDWYHVLDHTFLTEDSTLCYGPAWSDDQFEVSVVYYRAGYESREYEEDGKNIRLHLERSRAIKCPDVLTHLTTLKVVQAALTAAGAVERYLPPEKAAEVRNTFMAMHVLDGSQEGLRFRQEAMNATTAVNYVVKPNLEGGGHNVYEDAVPEFLALISENEQSCYTIMRMIEPPEVYGLLETPELRYRGRVKSELGVLGTCLFKRHGDGVEIISNRQAGWTFKTKPASVKEMNVVKGNGCFDCPLLS